MAAQLRRDHKLVRGQFSLDPIYDLQDEPCPIFQGSAILYGSFISALIARARRNLTFVPRQFAC